MTLWANVSDGVCTVGVHLSCCVLGEGGGDRYRPSGGGFQHQRWLLWSFVS